MVRARVQVVGAMGFIIASAMLMVETQKHWWQPRPLDIGWHVAFWNLVARTPRFGAAHMSAFCLFMTRHWNLEVRSWHLTQGTCQPSCFGMSCLSELGGALPDSAQCTCQPPGAFEETTLDFHHRLPAAGRCHCRS